MLGGTDCCFLSSGYIYYARESIRAILGEAQRHTSEVGDYLC